MIKRLIAALFIFTAPLYAESIAVGNLRGLNNGDASILINDNEAQDLLNVDITENGYGVKKRAGISLFKTIGTSTWGVRGGAFFRDISGVDTIVHANNRSVFKSVGGGNYSAFITTDTAGSYYDFTDSQGYLYRFNSNRDEIFRYNGTAVTYFPSAPKGDQGEAMPDRMAISGTTAEPNTVHFSKLADFTTYTTGNETADAFTESFGLPGQKINAIKYACGRLLVWTNTTMSFWAGSSQFDGLIQDISTTVGCSQPSSVVSDLGLVYWQALDGHFYAYDCNSMTKISRPISGSVSSYTGGESKSWLQTTQADFEAGTLDGTSATISPGDVVLSSWTDTDTTAINFASGTLTNLTTSTVSGALYLTTTTSNVNGNGSFENGTGIAPDEWVVDTSAFFYGMRSSTQTTAQSGSFALIHDSSQPAASCGADQTIIGGQIAIRDANGGAITSSTVAVTTSYSQFTVNLTPYIGRTIKLAFRSSKTGVGSPPCGTPGYVDVFVSSAFYVVGGNLTGYVKAFGTGNSKAAWDNIAGTPRSTIVDGNILSRTFDTAISTPAYIGTATWTTNGHSISAQTQTSADGSSWDSLVAWSTGAAPGSARKRYIRYKVSIATATAGTAVPYLSDVTLQARQSTGTFISQIKEIGTAITSWGNFYADDVTNSGTIAYFIRTSSTSGGISSASWSALTDGSQISASTNAFVQVKASFTVTAQSYDPTLQNFTIAWNEGTVTRTWGTVDKDHRIVWSVAENASAVPNASYIYDPRFDSWLKYSVPFDAPARVGNSVFIGSPTAGNVYSWPSGTNDAGSAFEAFWQSKDFLGSDPFAEKVWERYSTLGLKVAGSNIDIAYSTNTVGSYSNNFSLTDAQDGTFKRINALFRSGTTGTFLNMRFGNDDSDAPFEIYTFRLDYSLKPWRVLP